VAAGAELGALSVSTMSSMTKSEFLFEKFCQVHHISYERILPGALKTPDYNIYVDETKIVIEVKEIEVNTEEQQKINEFDKQRTISIKSALGKRIRDKITDAAGKFKEAARNGHPSILVLYNKVRLYKHTSPGDILAGMYGQLYFPVYRNAGETLTIGEMKSGPKKKMTQTMNTSMSAVGVLNDTGTEGPRFSIYHNFHAKVRLDPLLFWRFNVKSYWVNDLNKPTRWVEMEQPSQ
jgi:hypothetical protein